MNQQNPPIFQGQIWYAQLPATNDNTDNDSSDRHPILIIQSDAFNRSALPTVVCVALSTNWQTAPAPGHVLLSPSDTLLPKACVANTPHILTLNKTFLREYVSTLPPWVMETVLDGVKLVLGRD